MEEQFRSEYYKQTLPASAILQNSFKELELGPFVSSRQPYKQAKMEIHLN